MTIENENERKQPQNVNYQQINSHLGDVIHLLENAPESPRVSQAMGKLREITDERKQPQNMNYQQINSHLGDVINLLQNAPESPKVTQALQQLQEITEQMRTLKAA